MSSASLRRLGSRTLAVGVLAAAMLVPATEAQAIVGGAPAPPGRWPWVAALLRTSEPDAGRAQFCGGAVIAPRRVLTAGHCVLGRSARSVDVLVGRTRLAEHNGRRIHVTAISVFPGRASGRTPGLDAAIVTLSADAGVPPLALARPGQEAAWAPETPAWTMGWGQLNGRSSPGGYAYFADRLRELALPTQGDDACEGVYGRGWIDFPYRPEWLVCAGTADGRTGTCYGDSGAPLVVQTPEGWLDVGIDVGGDGCASRGYYELYSRVDRISDFALQAAPATQPEPVARPSIAGRLVAGARVRCLVGQWRGGPARLSVRWLRAGSAVGRGATHRMTAGDLRRGITCAVTATSRGGSVTATAPAVQAHGSTRLRTSI